MKSFQKALAIVLCGVVFGVVLTATAGTGIQQGWGTVVRVEGLVSYSLGDGNWHPLVAGKYLPPGAQIRTGETGVADVVLGKAIELPQAKWQPERISLAPDSPVRGMVSYKPSAEQNVVRLTPNTTLGIDKLTITDTGADTVSDTELDLKQGKIYASVKKISGASQYTVKIPNGIAGVRGTLFSITAAGVVAVYDTHTGGLVLSQTQPDGSNKIYLVTSGQVFDPATGRLVPITPELRQILFDIFTALRTIYIQVLDYNFKHTRTHYDLDRTQTPVSPTKPT
ncbi:MAG: FecR domain-containing protein [Verrucomicrobiota bacterium]